MKKIVLATVLPILIFLGCFKVQAADIKTELENELINAVDDEFFDALSPFGIESIEDIYSASFESIIGYFRQAIEGRFDSVLKIFFRLCGIMFFLSVICSLVDDVKSRDMLIYFACAAVILILIGDMNNCLNATLSMLKVSNSFMTAFVPVFAVIIALSGTPQTALTYSAAALLAGEVISFLINFGLVDLIGAFLCLGIAFSFNPDMKASSLISSINRLTGLIVGACSTLFASVLSIKGVMSYSADSITTKGARFLLGSLIPIVGSSISDAYSSLLGSINIIKGSFALVGIVGIIVINIPILAENLAFYLTLNVLGLISNLMSMKSLTDIFSVFSSALRMLLLLTVLEIFVLIISTGIMLSFKGG